MFRGVPVLIFIDFDAHRASENLEKPMKNLCFSMVFAYSAKSLLNRNNAAMGGLRTLKMEAQSTQNYSRSATMCPTSSNMSPNNAKTGPRIGKINV